jgi:tetratricopeptide (TPR) repeat protein
VFLSFSAQTIRRNFQLKNHWTVFHADEKVAPLSFRGLFTLGAEYVNMKFPDKALEYYKKAFETGSWDGNLLSNMIGYYILKGDHISAINYYEEMIRRKEFITPNGVLNISVLYMINGNCDEAVRLATSFHPLTNQIKRVELVKQCEKHNFARFDNNSIEDIHEKQLLMKELGLEIERKPYLSWLLQATVNSETVNSEQKDSSLLTRHSSLVTRHLSLLRELAVVNLQSDIPEAIFYYKMERDLHIKKGNPVPPIVEQSIHALEYYQHQVLVEGKYIKLDW